MTKTGILLRLSPLLVPFLLLFTGGLGLAVLQSFGLMLGFPYEGGPLDAWRMLLTEGMLRSMGLSVYVALVSAALSVGLGMLMAFGVWRLPPRLHPAASVYRIPLILPHIAVAFIVLVFWTQSGLAASVLHSLGLIESPADFPALLYGGSGAGMILAYVYKQVPFAMLMVYAVLQRLDPGLLQTARMLGASRLRTYLRVVVPHCAPVAHTTFIIFFLHAFGAFEIPFLLGESSPGMLSVEVFNLYFRRDLSHRPQAMAVLVSMFVFSAVFIVSYFKVVSRLNPRERKL